MDNILCAKNNEEYVCSKNWEGLGLTADVNEYVDQTIPMVVSAMQAHGLDPMPLPDMEEGFEVVSTF